MTIAPAQPYPALGTAAVIPVTVTAKDLAGNVIAPPDTYSTPITLIDQDTSGHTSFSRTTITSPSDSVTLRYDGAYFPPAGLTANWADPTGVTIEPFRQIATGIVTTERSLGSGHILTSLVAGSDGALWFADWGGAAVGRATTGGATSYSALSQGWSPQTLAAGPDGAIWFVAGGPFYGMVKPYPGIGRVALDGTVGPINATSYAYSRELVSASDGNLYLNQLNHVTQITTSGQMSYVPVGPNGTHTDTLAAGSDGALYATAVGTLLRYDLTRGTTSTQPFPTPPGAIRPIEPGLLAALSDGRLYFDDKGTWIYSQTVPAGTPALIGRGSATPGQGDAVSPTSFALARDGSLWLTSSMTTQDGHPMLGHVLGGAIQMLAGQAAVAHQNTNFQDVPASSLVLGSDGRLWYERNDALGSFAP